MGTEALDLPPEILAERLASGAVRAPKLALSINARLAERDGRIGAFVWHDPEFLAAQADRREAERKANRGVGRLHGMPVAVTDTIDTVGIPTCNGTSVDEGRTPRRDAFVVSRLKVEGALIVGKTATTELAGPDPSGVRNPHDLSRSAGGSSGGAAAAVAAGLVPFAIGTQTNGSVIRSAAFCGITGYKPSFGRIPRTGILPQSPSLDTVGVFARTPLGVAMLAETLFGDDPADGATAPRPAPRLSDAVARGPGVPPTFAVLHPPGWDMAEAQTRAAIDELTEALGDRAFQADLPEIFDEAELQRERVNLAEMTHTCRRYVQRDGVLPPGLRDALDLGAALSATDYLAARDWSDVLSAGLSEILRRADAILCPATLGPAPGPQTTGDPVFCGLWTFVGFPAVTVPLFTSEEGLPMGVQVIAGRGDDARCLASAQWLHDWASEEGDTG